MIQDPAADARESKNVLVEKESFSRILEKSSLGKNQTTNDDKTQISTASRLDPPGNHSYFERMHTWLFLTLGKKEAATFNTEQRNKALYFYKSIAPYYWIKLINLSKGKPILFRSEEQAAIFDKFNDSSKILYFQEGNPKAPDVLNSNIFCAIEVKTDSTSHLKNPHDWLLRPIKEVKVIPKYFSRLSGVKISFETPMINSAIALDSISCYIQKSNESDEAYKNLTLLDLFYSLGINGVYTYPL